MAHLPSKVDAVEVSQAQRERFWAKVRVSGPGECWPWLGPKSNRGYGVSTIRFSGKWSRTSSSRLAFLLANGPIAGSLHVLHTCDNPPCCNPAHLFLGTCADNPRAFTDRQVAEMRARRAAGEQYTVIARDYGVSRTAISYIVRGVIYREKVGHGFRA